LNEKRAAVGYAPLEEPPPEPATETDRSSVLRKYRPDQARAPAGTSDGGEWVDEGGGGGSRVGTSVASGVGAPARDGRSKEEFVRVAQAEEPDKGPVNLREEDDRLGGHTTTRHVAQPDDELLAIVRRDRIVGLTVTVARKRQGSFLTIEDANNFVNRVLEDNAGTVREVAKGEKYEAEFVKKFGYVTGKEAFRPDADAEPYMRPTYEVYVHIEADKRSKKGYRVFRAFPINSKPNKE